MQSTSIESNNFDSLSQKYSIKKSFYDSELLKQIILELDQKSINQRMKEYYLSFLKMNGFYALHDLLNSQIDYDQFKERVILEIRTNKTLIIPSVFEHPDYQKKHQENHKKEVNKKIRAYFGVRYIEPKQFKPLMSVLRKLHNKKRINEAEKAFLLTEKDENGESYFNYYNIYTQYHLIEGSYYLDEYKKHKNIWKLINASGHFRKAKEPEEVKEYLETVDKKRLSSLKIESAYFTTYGGVNRDLGNLSQALEFAHTAHNKREDDYRPCTLLGAIYFDLEDIDKGQEWFTKAKILGADDHAFISEIKGIYLKASKEYQIKLENHFKYENKDIFNWIKLQKKKNKRANQKTHIHQDELK
ncbi:TPA: hypothetical protein QB443_000580 [Pasteurella multocida]|nr:hypothetical protein [Pasteurella multocida]